jgi:hypothetical protein
MYSDDQSDWEKHIRTDMWNDMSAQQLVVQQELIIEKLGKLSYMGIGNPTVVMLRNALAVAGADISALIDSKLRS